MFGRPHRTPVCTRVGQNGQLVYEVLRGYGQAPFYTGNISRTFSLRLGDCRGIEAPWISLLSDIINKREFVNFYNARAGNNLQLQFAAPVQSPVLLPVRRRSGVRTAPHMGHANDIDISRSSQSDEIRSARHTFNIPHSPQSIVGHVPPLHNQSIINNTSHPLMTPGGQQSVQREINTSPPLYPLQPVGLPTPEQKKLDDDDYFNF